MISAAHLRFRKGDLLAILLVAVLAVAVLVCYLPPKGPSSGQAVIYLDGEVACTVDLSSDQTIVISGRYRNEIRVENGAIFFAASDCPGEDCVHSGRIHTQGRSLVCLPNGLEIRIVSAEEDVDFVVR